METNDKRKKTKALAMLVIVFASIMLLSCIVLHVNPLELEGLIFDFAVHHYFWFGFISLLIAMLSTKLYFSIYKESWKNPRNVREIIRSSYHKNRRRSRYYYNKFKTNIDKQNIVFIDTKSIDHLNFSQDDVLKTYEEKKSREFELKKSMTLGNQYKQKVKIFFKVENNAMCTETTVWYADQKYISLKGGVALPVRSVYKIIV